MKTQRPRATRHLMAIVATLTTMLFGLPAGAQEKQVFTPTNLDYTVSPLTGITRQHWIDAGTYLLEGAFSYIHCLDDPMYFPKQLEKTYPRGEKDTKVAKLEGLARTFFVAAPLLREKPDLTLNGIGVADYYVYQLRQLINPESKHHIAHRTGGPSQTLLELGSIAISLQVTGDIVWGQLTKEEQDAVAATMLSYGEGPTIGSNWMFFNVFILSFFKEQGYTVDETKLVDWLEKLLARYRGEGWYNDAPAYDYYSQWAYQSYGPLWAELWGKKTYPELAERFIANQRDIVDNYPYMFARDGRMNMWGRSIPYRFACTTPLSLLEMTGTEGVNYGWLRFIASSTLMQFLTHPDFLENGVPTMGFYGPFAPCVQIYSCRGSVYWMGKAFWSLLLPASAEYWTATENQGPWEDELKPGNVYNKLQPATGLLITNYPNAGCSEMRSWCKETVAGDWQKFRSSENYNKLAYNTAFPWMADGKDGEISQNYGTRNAKGEWEVLRLYDYQSFEDGVYRRDAVLETDTTVRYKLADIPLADGILRIDEVSTAQPTEIRLGHYSLPITDSATFSTDNQGQVSNGEYQLALVPVYGWQSTPETVVAKGLHPASSSCAVPMLSATNDGTHIYATLMLWKKLTDDGGQLTEAELNPIKSIKVDEAKHTVKLKLKNGQTKTVQF